MATKWNMTDTERDAARAVAADFAERADEAEWPFGDAFRESAEWLTKALDDADEWRTSYEFLASALKAQCDAATVERVMGSAERCLNVAMNLAAMSRH